MRLPTFTIKDDRGAEVRQYPWFRLSAPDGFTRAEWRDLRKRIWQSSPAPYFLWILIVVASLGLLFKRLPPAILEPSLATLTEVAVNAAVIALLIGLERKSIPVTTPQLLRKTMLKCRRCPSCAQRLEGVPTQDDGRKVCPECGAAWRLPQSEPRSTQYTR